jgi:solute carrier family 35 (UDP-sugar transporter), member A1/2/3
LPLFSVAIAWSIQSWLSIALVPAALYALQNIAALTAYQNLDALTFNVLNQTKTLSAALCCLLLLGKRQSRTQVVALFLLLAAALVMEGILNLNTLTGQGLNSNKANDDSVWKNRRHWTHGVAPVALASFISGWAGALSQKSLQSSATSTNGRNAYLFSLELCVASSLFLIASMMVSPDGEKVLTHGFWYQWTPETWIPIVTNCVGGIVVGLVTKYAGAVRKGFALIFGMLISGIVQAMVEPHVKIPARHIVGGILAAISLYLHAAYPPTSSKGQSSTVTTTKKLE